MVATADIDKAMSQISDIELALDRKDARIKELEEEVGRLTAERNDSVIEAAAMGIANGHLHSLLEEQGIRLTLADKLAEAAWELWKTSDDAHYDEDLIAALAAYKQEAT